MSSRRHLWWPDHSGSICSATEYPCARNGKAGYASCNESSFPRVRLHVICLAAVIVSCKRSRNRIALVSPIDEVFVAEFFCQSAPKIKLRYWHTGCSSIAVDARTHSSKERKQARIAVSGELDEHALIGDRVVVESELSIPKKKGQGRMFVHESDSGGWNALSAMLLSKEFILHVSNRAK